MKNVGIIKENFDLAHKFTKLLNIKEMNAVELPLYNSVQINSLVLKCRKRKSDGRTTSSYRIFKKYKS